ncbi:MAG: HDIG domain-containing protein [Eubacteriales bacterium]|nr:HDIG domain-containing protein [Eubacteriales bacterium]
MGSVKPTRDEALSLLKKYTKSESLIRHALTVEAVMLHFADLLGEADREKWSVVGLLHDIDFEMYPEEHCKKAEEILSENNIPDDYIHAVVSHGFGVCYGVEPVEKMEKVLYAIDELTGLIAATALMRPSRSILDTEVRSVMKKWKQRSFAAGVDRELIEEGVKKLGMELEYIVEETIKGMRKVAESIGLKGEAGQL